MGKRFVEGKPFILAERRRIARDQPVVRNAVRVADDIAERDRQHKIVASLFHFHGITLAVYFIEREVFFARLFVVGKFFADGKRIGVLVAQDPEKRVEVQFYAPSLKSRKPHKPRSKGRAFMRSAERGEAGDAVFHSEIGDNVFRDQPALGVGDEIDLFHAFLLADLQYFVFKDQRVIFYLLHRADLAFDDGKPKFLEFFVYLAEGLDEEDILYEDPVDQYYRVFGKHSLKLRREARGMRREPLEVVSII